LDECPCLFALDERYISLSNCDRSVKITHNINFELEINKFLCKFGLLRSQIKLLHHFVWFSKNAATRKANWKTLLRAYVIRGNFLIPFSNCGN